MLPSAFIIIKEFNALYTSIHLSTALKNDGGIL